MWLKARAVRRRIVILAWPMICRRLRTMTVTAGLASAQPGRDEEVATRLVEQAQQALLQVDPKAVVQTGSAAHRRSSRLHHEASVEDEGEHDAAQAAGAHARGTCRTGVAPGRGERAAACAVGRSAPANAGFAAMSWHSPHPWRRQSVSVCGGRFMRE